jgi:hypothetical protein
MKEEEKEVFERLYDWYLQDRVSWINGIINMPEYYSTHLSQDPEIIIKTIKNGLIYNLNLGLLNKQINKDDIDFLIGRPSLVKEFIIAIFEGLKVNFPLIENN